jgi:hypothetical protein
MLPATNTRTTGNQNEDLIAATERYSERITANIIPVIVRRQVTCILYEAIVECACRALQQFTLPARSEVSGKKKE